MSKRRKQVSEVLRSIHRLKHKIVLYGYELLKEIGITHSQWMVLNVIENNKEASIKDISNTLGTSSSATTQLVNALVAKGYLEKKINEEDKRNLKIIMTKKSTSVIEKIKKEEIKKMGNLFQILSNKEFDIYYNLVKKITEKSKEII